MPETAQEIIMRLRAMIPSFNCLPGCTDCCGPHPWSKWEWEQVPVKRHATEITCPYATPSGCEVYEHRPIVCRIFGTIDSLPCPHGRRPLAMLSPVQEGEIMGVYLQLMDTEKEQCQTKPNLRNRKLRRHGRT